MFKATLLFLCGALLRPVQSSGGYDAPFGCPTKLKLNDTGRTAALSLINEIRSLVALGQFPAFMSSAEHMNKLQWNCDLELVAETAVTGCPQLPPIAPSANGFNYRYFPQQSSIIDLSYPIQRTILEWTNLQDAWNPNNTFDGNPLLLDFANMILANTTSVGCSGAICSSASSAACVFSAPDVQRGQQVYNSGGPCPNGEQCFGPDPGVCHSALCVITLNTSTTTVPSNATTTTTTTATTTTKKKSTDCPSKAFSITFRDVALGMHNNFRSLVARGLARNAEYPGEFAPPASRMDLLEYDCYAEQLALIHARSCDGKPSPPHTHPGYSENIHVLRTTATDLLGAIQNAVATFTSELGVNGIPSNMILTPQVYARTQRTVLRVTKVIWGSNRFVACATVLCSGFYFTSCLYKDPVNVVGQNIYSIGAVCSACPTGPKNCNPAIGLCSY